MMKWKNRKKNETENTAGIPISAQLANVKIWGHRISKVYHTKKGDYKAIDEVDIEVLDNDFVCIVGPSGCGKSTLLRMMAGLDFPTSGVLMIDNREINEPGADRGMVFQTYTLFPWLTVSDNIKYGLKLKNLSKDESEKITNKYLKAIGLEKFKDSYPKELSGGMKQRVAIARALANSPEVLLMDEPFGALDPQTKSQMQLLLREIWQVEKPTVIFVTHDIDEAVFLANKIYIMSANPGKIVKEQPIHLPYERTLEIKETTEFFTLRKKVNACIKS